MLTARHLPRTFDAITQCTAFLPISHSRRIAQKSILWITCTLHIVKFATGAQALQRHHTKSTHLSKKRTTILSLTRSGGWQLLVNQQPQTYPPLEAMFLHGSGRGIQTNTFHYLDFDF